MGKLSTKILFFIWFTFIVVFSVSSFQINQVVTIPDAVRSDSGFIYHLIGYFVLGLLSFFAFSIRRFGLCLVALFLLSFFFELVQLNIASRTFNMEDLLANAFGLLGSAWVVYIFSKELK